MDILVITVSQGPSQLAFFRFSVSIHALSILEQLDFEEGKPVYPDGSIMSDEDIEHIKEQGAVIPRTVTIDPKTFLELVSLMDPNKEYENLDPDVGQEKLAKLKQRSAVFVLQRKVMEGAIRTIADEENVFVTLALMPVIEEFHGPGGNPYPDEDTSM